MTQCGHAAPNVDTGVSVPLLLLTGVHLVSVEISVVADIPELVQMHCLLDLTSRRTLYDAMDAMPCDLVLFAMPFSSVSSCVPHGSRANASGNSISHLPASVMSFTRCPQTQSQPRFSEGGVLLQLYGHHGTVKRCRATLWHKTLHKFALLVAVG